MHGSSITLNIKRQKQEQATTETRALSSAFAVDSTRAYFFILCLDHEVALDKQPAWP